MTPPETKREKLGVLLPPPADEARRGAGMRLANPPPVSPESEHAVRAITLVDPAKQALHSRIETARMDLFADLNRASSILRSAARTARRGLLRVAVVAGLVLAGALVAAARRRRRLHVVWK
jgi:hypothetical protein